MTTRERLERECKLGPSETLSDTERCTVRMYVGDLRKLLAVLDAARACGGYITTSEAPGLGYLTNDLHNAVQECDE